MPQANVDPAELRRFAQDLSRFSTELRGLMSGLHARMLGLEKSWRDQEQRKFFQEFEQTVKTLNRFLESSDAHVQFLAKKAAHVENYLQQH